MTPSRLLSLPIIVASLALGACASDGTTASGDLDLQETDLEGVGKADHLSLELTEIDIAIDQDLLFKGGSAVVTSAESFEEYFGSPAPADIDFDKEWVAFYGAGTYNSGGLSVDITDMILLPQWWGGLVMDLKVNQAGPDCLVTFAITTPHAVVKFDAPSHMPDWFAIDRDHEVIKCGPDNADRLAELAVSLEDWTVARDDNNDSYTYTSEFQSFTGFGARTTIVVEEGEVVERHYKAQHISGGDSTQWSEAGSDLGTHLEGAKIKTIDELYTVCAEEILTLDEEAHWINLFVDSSDGIMRNCSASNRLCNDDCSFGPNIATIEF